MADRGWRGGHVNVAGEYVGEFLAVTLTKEIVGNIGNLSNFMKFEIKDEML